MHSDNMLKEKIKEILVKSAKENIRLDKAIDQILSATEEDKQVVENNQKNIIIDKLQAILDIKEAEQQVLDEIREMKTLSIERKGYCPYSNKIKSWQKRLKK